MPKELYFRRKLQRFWDTGSERFMVCVPATIARSLDCDRVDFVVRNGEVCLLPVNEEPRA